MGISISDLSSINNVTSEKKQSKNESGQLFEGIYKSAIGFVEDTNQLQKQADKISLDFAAGKVDSIHDVMIAQEKANIALQFTVQLRNQLLDAYNEIIRIQV